MNEKSYNDDTYSTIISGCRTDWPFRTWNLGINPSNLLTMLAKHLWYLTSHPPLYPTQETRAFRMDRISRCVLQWASDYFFYDKKLGHQWSNTPLRFFLFTGSQGQNIHLLLPPNHSYVKVVGDQLPRQKDLESDSVRECLQLCWSMMTDTSPNHPFSRKSWLRYSSAV